MPTIGSPATHAATKGTVGFDYVFAAQEIQEEIAEQMNVLDAGLAWGAGDVAETGSDTIRITRYGGLGWAETMQALSGETDPVTPTGYTLGLDTVTVGRYGLAKEQSFQDQGLQRRGQVNLDLMKAAVASSWLATMRELVVLAGASFASGVGNSGVRWSVDDELELIAAFQETNGFDLQRMPVPRTMRHPRMFTQLRNSLRNEPGFQNDAQLMQSLLGMAGKDAGGSFSFLGLQNYASHDVPSAAGDFTGSAYVPGAIMWAVMSPAAIRSANPAATTVIPQYGIIILEQTVGGVATGRFDVNAWFGVDLVSAALAPQFKMTCLDDR